MWESQSPGNQNVRDFWRLGWGAWEKVGERTAQGELFQVVLLLFFLLSEREFFCSFVFVLYTSIFLPEKLKSYHLHEEREREKTRTAALLFL